MVVVATHGAGLELNPDLVLRVEILRDVHPTYLLQELTPLVRKQLHQVAEPCGESRTCHDECFGVAFLHGVDKYRPGGRVLEHNPPHLD
ncbi:MAG: hypothetical protein ACK559_33265, partial [bacterium]